MTVPTTLPASLFNVLVNTRHGMMLANRNDQYVGQSLIHYGEFSEGESHLFRQLVGPGDVVVEAGANIGAHTVMLSRLVGDAGRVLAYEPQRIVFQTLCANLGLTQCVNVHALQQGLGAARGEMSCPAVDPRASNNFGGLSLLPGGGGEAVAVTTLDALNLQQCRLLKADVEGMEREVLLGARETLARCRPVLYLENDRTAKSPDLIQLVMELGYRVWWHITPLFNPQNFAGNATNLFGNTVSINIFCQPKESAKVVEGLREITSPSDEWNAPA